MSILFRDPNLFRKTSRKPPEETAIRFLKRRMGEKNGWKETNLEVCLQIGGKMHKANIEIFGCVLKWVAAQNQMYGYMIYGRVLK